MHNLAMLSFVELDALYRYCNAELSGSFPSEEALQFRDQVKEAIEAKIKLLKGVGSQPEGPGEYTPPVPPTPTPVPPSQNSPEVDKILIEFAKQQRKKAYGAAQRTVYSSAAQWKEQLDQFGATAANKEYYEGAIFALQQVAHGFRAEISFDQVDMSDIGQLPTIPTDLRGE